MEQKEKLLLESVPDCCSVDPALSSGVWMLERCCVEPGWDPCQMRHIRPWMATPVDLNVRPLSLVPTPSLLSLPSLNALVSFRTRNSETPTQVLCSVKVVK